jgi:hypothetical protein
LLMSFRVDNHLPWMSFSFVAALPSNEFGTKSTSSLKRTD